MTQHERIIAAAEAVAAGSENYSCNALRRRDVSPGEYARIFAPSDGSCVPSVGYGMFLHDLRKQIPGTRELRQWRVLSLCFYAAMQEND